MMTKEMIRCKDCAYLVEGDNGEWICTDWNKEIHKVDDEDCALESEAEKQLHFTSLKQAGDIHMKKGTFISLICQLAIYTIGFTIILHLG